MKKLLFILSLFFVTSFAANAQGDDEKIRDKMIEFIQQRMNLNKNEAERFTPVFLRYFREWRSTLRDNRGDRLILQQKVVELRLRYRTEFKDIVGERRCNEIYEHQERFIQGIREIKKESIRERRGPGGRIRAMRF
jgi:hypothetical protein